MRPDPGDTVSPRCLSRRRKDHPVQSIKDDLYSTAFRYLGMQPLDQPNSYGPAGDLYRFENESGQGEYWVYFRDNLFAVNAFFMTFNRSGIMRYPHTEHLSISAYDAADFSAHNCGYKPRTGVISTYLAEEGAEYVASFQPGSVLQATSITISPDYYRDRLQIRFGDIPDVRRAFALVDGRQDIPELIGLLRQVRAYQGEGMSAHLFYEGVVAEVLALVIERASRLEAELIGGASAQISREDRIALDRLSAYIKTNPHADLSCKELARRSCMGQTKLKAAFKTVFGTSPAAYVAQMRIEGARELLTTTDLPIAQVARTMGYRKPGAFAEAFRRRTGVVPSAFRRRGA